MEFMRGLDWSPLLISLNTGVVATILSFFGGIFAARQVIKAGPKTKAVLDGILTLPMVLPPTVAGFFLLLIFSLRRPFGAALYEGCGIKVVQTWLGCVLAATVIAFPLMYRNARAAFEQIDSNIIQQRLLDGYINATALCKAAKKRMYDYLRLENTKAFIRALESKTRIPASTLIQTVKGGNIELQGTWVHPFVAGNLAQWADANIAADVSIWIAEWMNGGIKPQPTMPYHLQRYLLNEGKIPKDKYFSVFNEIVYSLIAPLEQLGYTLPDNLVPDISEAKIFCNWLRKEKGVEPKDFPTYTHEYGDGRNIPGVKLYPNEYLADFRAHFNDVWLLQRAQNYFFKKDKTALPYVQKMILQLPKAEQEQIKMLPDKSKEELPNDEFDKGIDKILGFEED